MTRNQTACCLAATLLLGCSGRLIADDSEGAAGSGGEPGGTSESTGGRDNGSGGDAGDPGGAGIPAAGADATGGSAAIGGSGGSGAVGGSGAGTGVAGVADSGGSGGSGGSSGASGSAGTGATACGAGTVACSGTCVDIASDASNCGACGVTCSTGPCEAGICVDDPPSCEDAVFRDKYTPGYTEPRNPDVDSLLPTMTLEEKAQQMRGLDDRGRSNWDDIMRTEDNPDKDIRGYYFRDGPRGVNLEARQHNRVLGQDYSTAFPVPAAVGASFDLDLAYRMGEAMGDETVASMNTILLAPCMNVLRNPAWGRAQETYGEDTWHLGRMASAFTAGLQTYVAGCAKYYAANNIEEDRFLENAVMDEQTLREIYTRHFEMVVKDGGVACVMAAYNSVTGTHCTQHRHLLREILKQDMGFRGFVLSDWWATPPGKETDLAASVYRENAIVALEAGLDLEVPWRLNYSQIPSMVEDGLVDGELVDDAVGRILEQKYRFNSHNLAGPYGLREPVTSLNAEGSIIDNESHLELAREAAVKSMVLLKNEEHTLPIPGSIGTIGVVGGVGLALVTSDCWSADCVPQPVSFAEQIRTGDRGSSRVKADPDQSVPPLAGIREAAARHGVNVEFGYSAAEVPNAELLVVVVGLTAEDEGEEYTGAADRQNLRLDGKHPENPTPQAAAIQGAIDTGKPVVVVLVGGSVIDLEGWGIGARAIVMSWYPGQQGGGALGDLLFGDANFSGKLPITWSPYEDWPTFDEGAETQMDYYVGYKWFDILGLTPQYPWGHGLSYTTFEYSNLTVPCESVTQGAVLQVTADVTNIGSVVGDEVAFLFVGWPNTIREKSRDGTGNSKAPLKELKGFVRLPQIAPGETRRARIPLRIADLKYWDLQADSWRVEPGQVDIMVGPSSADFPLVGTVTVQ